MHGTKYYIDSINLNSVIIILVMIFSICKNLFIDTVNQFLKNIK